MPDMDHVREGRFAPPDLEVFRRPDGSILLRSPHPLEAHARSIGVYLEHWALVAPTRLFVQERAPNARWCGPTYSEAHGAVQRIATWLVHRRLAPARPVAILSENAVTHALLMLAAMHVGIPVAPISPAYSLLCTDYTRLRGIVRQVNPGLIYVADHNRFGPALAAIRSDHDAIVVSSGEADAKSSVVSFHELTQDLDTAAVAERLRNVGPDTVAKLLFTSGSTGEPKGVITTQRMLCTNQQARAQVWPFLATEPPVLVDWLPWSHTFGGSHNFNLVVRHGGTLYIDTGRPAPTLFDTTLANLRDVAPTVYFNVPRGYDMLVPALRRDDALRHHFFSRLRVAFYAAAALPPHLWDALHELAAETATDAPPLICSAWGTTETAPLATACHFQADQPGVIGLPAPGTEIKLVPRGDRLEIRVRGSNVTPGYWKRPDLTAAQFDPEGFCLTGDAVRFVDPAHPERGLLFDGRLSEDFKLDSGTWVNVTLLRTKAIANMAPVAQDVVVAGHDRNGVGLLIFPNVPACRELARSVSADAPLEQVLEHPAVRAQVSHGLTMLRNQGAGSSTFAARAILLADPPAIERGEITDKGHVNQAAVLKHRAQAVECLFASNPTDRVIRLAT